MNVFGVKSILLLGKVITIASVLLHGPRTRSVVDTSDSNNFESFRPTPRPISASLYPTKTTWKSPHSLPVCCYYFSLLRILRHSLARRINSFISKDRLIDWISSLPARHSHPLLYPVTTPNLSAQTRISSMSFLPLTSSAPLSTSQKEELRHSAKLVFHNLEDASQRTQKEFPTKIPSWVRSPDSAANDGKNGPAQENPDDNSWKKGRSSTCHYFDMYGFCVRRQFCSAEEVADLKQEMKRMVDELWHPGKVGDGNSDENEEEEPDYAFATDSKSNTQRGDYFLDSADRVSYFAEPQALDAETGKLKEEYHDDKLAALNKAGHGMHTIPHSPFSKYTLSDKMRSLVHELGWQHPVIPQSMYIFKQPSIGGTVHSHQDSTFLYTVPKQSCLGLWLALDDATLDNGCLWVRPQSHMEPVRRQFIRNPKFYHNDTDTAGEDGQDKAKDSIPSGGSSSTPKLIFEDRHPTPAKVTWEGGLPEHVQTLSTSHVSDSAYNDPLQSPIFDSFVPVEVKAGDLVVFCGTLDHFSLPNFSSLPRQTFQLHLIEGPKAGVEWSAKNWLQYPKEKPFLELTS
jgi:phytanoyl-CoA hydroxylase